MHKSMMMPRMTDKRRIFTHNITISGRSNHFLHNDTNYIMCVIL
jgi:hypothetical protein